MYIFLRVILSIVSRLSKDSLGEALGTKLEDMLWRYVTVSREEIRDVPNRTANRELLCEVLGALANIRSAHFPPILLFSFGWKLTSCTSLQLPNGDGSVPGRDPEGRRRHRFGFRWRAQQQGRQGARGKDGRRHPSDEDVQVEGKPFIDPSPLGRSLLTPMFFFVLGVPSSSL
jgi:hypothetical protein